MTILGHILIADDEPDLRLLMELALRRAGFAVTPAANGEEAVRLFGEQTFDLVILDVAMPVVDGNTACAWLRGLAGQELPIVMITGRDDIASVERAYESGATDFISKPLNWPLLVHRVKYLLRTQQVVRDLHAANARNAAIADALRQSEAFMQQAQAVARLGTWCFELGPRTLTASPQVSHIYNLPAHEPLNYEVLSSCVHPEDAGVLERAWQDATAGNTFQAEYRIVVQGAVRWVQVHAQVEVDAACVPVRCFGTVQDVTERKDAESRIHDLAYFDTLTRLPSRQAFIERLEREVQRSGMAGRKLGVLFLDLDGFKNINDTLGHVHGDRVLQEVAERLRLGVRPCDMLARDTAGSVLPLARLGGDEFTVLVPDIRAAEDVLVVAERVKELLRAPVQLDDAQVTMSASIGIAIFPDDGADGTALLQHAHSALHFAKDAGRDTCQFYRASMTKRAVERMTLDNHLRLALEREEFFVVYQPQYCVRSARIRAMEALVRWQHPERGLVSPVDFISRAEENGLIVPLGEWVLRAACRDLVRWLKQDARLRVAVNLSPRQFRNPALVDMVRGILAETGVPPTSLELEVTEGTLMDCDDATLQTLHALRAMGLSIALDDFGTGYSSMSYLKRLPLTHLKVDRSFISGLPDSKDSLAIVRAILSMARNLGFTVTAEGVESAAQGLVLKELECDMLQGFYFSEPVPAADVPALLMQRWSKDLMLRADAA